MKRDGVWPAVGDPADPFVELPEDELSAACDPLRPAVTVRLPELPTFEEMARVAADYAPGAGNEAPDRVLGPWVDRLSATVPQERRLLLMALAAACFFSPDDDFRTPFQQWSRRSPAPSVADRSRFRAVAQAGWGCWEVESDPCGSQRVVSTVLAAADAQPPQLFPVEQWVVLPDRTPKFFVGRSVLTNAGHVLAMGLGVERVPPVSRIREFVRSETPGLHAGSADVWLRRRGHRLVRYLAEFEALVR